MELHASGGRVEHIDGLRAVAILGVLLFHAGIWSVPTSELQILSFGRLGVDLFFVISGFCMVWPVLHRGQTTVDRASFWRRRFLRVALPYWPVLAAAIAASWLVFTFGGPTYASYPLQSVFPTSAETVFDVVTHVLLLNGLFPAYGHSIDMAFWTLSTEWQFYLVFPLLWVASRRWGVPVVAGLALAASWGFALGVRLTRVEVSDALLPWWIGTFCVGMLVACVAHEAGRLRSWVLGAGALAAVVALPVEWAKGSQYPILRPLWGLAFGALLLASSRGLLHRGLTVVPLRHLGRWSYSAYLIHGTLFMLLSIPMSRGGWAAPVRVVVYFLVGVPLTVVLAWVYHRRVEQPTHELARRVHGNRLAADAR